MHPLVAAELQGRSSDSSPIPFRARPHHIHRTWARTFSSLPELYIQPESLPEIEKLVRLAHKCRRRIVTTGCGHSPSRLTCTSSWMVNLDRFNRVLAVDRSARIVTMQSGIRLRDLGAELDRHGLAMPNLGSINDQSIAGAISTGTHGSSLRHGLMSEDVVALKITLANGDTVSCSAELNPELFRAALLSLGALGIIVEVRFRAVPAFTLSWTQTIAADSTILDAWERDTLWTQSEFVRVWWLPYTRRAVVWRADRTDEDPSSTSPSSYSYDGLAGYHIYQNLLYLAQWLPRILPWVEWLVFGMQYGFKDGSSTAAVQPSRQALLMNCLYSQFVNEWAIPLSKGPEALRRLRAWLNHLQPGDRDYVPHGIPFSAEGLYVHAPLEVRVSDTSIASGPRPYLDPTVPDGPTLYLNATLYRPYWRDPPCRDRYYQGFEWLMRDLGGRPHWAKNFTANRPAIEALYGHGLDEFRRIRNLADPEGMFVGPWHRDHILARDDAYELEETETFWEKSVSDGVTVYGTIGGTL